MRINTRGRYASAATTAALAVALTGATYAAVGITGADIKNNTVTTKDIRDKTLTSADFSAEAKNTLKSSAGSVGPVGPAGAAGAAGPRGSAGAPGLVRGYARVHGVTVTRQSGGITATNPALGVVCVTVPGVDPATTAAVATLDYSQSSTNGSTQTFIEVNANVCPATSVGVVTYTRDFAAASGVTKTHHIEPFFILVP